MKPVAWAIKSDGDFTELGFDNDLLEEVEEMYAMEGWKYEVVPLYTAPRELSDEEIEALGREHIDIEWFDEGEYGMEYNMYGLVDFARAILKKASER